MKQNTELVLFQTSDGKVTFPVPVNDETVWLTRAQLSELFCRDIKTIGKHINNALREELVADSVVAKFATTAADGKTYQTEHYNLDMIISVGYRVKSNRGIEFRRWANEILRDYIIKGYAANHNRMQQIGEVINILKRTDDKLESGQILDVIEHYTAALELLDQYDHQEIKKPIGHFHSYVLTYEECRDFIDQMPFGAESSLFGNEKDESFKGILGAIYQSFDGHDLYPTREEKAAYLLYFTVKDHSFSDGNKRIAAALLLYFLGRNDILFMDGNKLIDDHTLVALTIMIAESRPEEKDIMINLIMNFLINTDIDYNQ
ncbi:MAG: virulence RhuM family protein [Clostridiales Family XIII bacterium]|jgi:prophage maintenance system killer protein|nr:virulence RhuM family protein [Clostridiales Family XIII bacterium]